MHREAQPLVLRHAAAHGRRPHVHTGRHLQGRVARFAACQRAGRQGAGAALRGGSRGDGASPAGGRAHALDGPPRLGLPRLPLRPQRARVLCASAAGPVRAAGLRGRGIAAPSRPRARPAPLHAPLRLAPWQNGPLRPRLPARREARRQGPVARVRPPRRSDEADARRAGVPDPRRGSGLRQAWRDWPKPCHWGTEAVMRAPWVHRALALQQQRTRVHSRRSRCFGE
mmetsp:Transcript_41011/g.101984  ORF Transcript_41011/g.101984 Transcript_41011/m.101984 type:complete len:227 (+) Transcript_41011:239-919(+)